MFGWFKRKEAPASGPDYRHVDSRAKAEALSKRGELQKLLLLPSEFGGEDIPPNVVYVPPFAAALKQRIDSNTVAPMARNGQATQYSATPEYEGNSVIPSQIRISATNPGHFEGTVAIWGRAIQQKAAAQPQGPAPAPELPPFRLDEFADTLEPKALVLAFIADYEAWNRYANEAHTRDPRSGKGMAAAESAYATLTGKFCIPGHRHQPIAFGNKSTHTSENEVIVSVDSTGDTSVVKTRHTKKVGTLSLTDDYEYHLKKANGRWFIVSVLYVDEEGKYEGL